MQFQNDISECNQNLLEMDVIHDNHELKTVPRPQPDSQNDKPTKITEEQNCNNAIKKTTTKETKSNRSKKIDHSSKPSKNRSSSKLNNMKKVI